MNLNVGWTVERFVEEQKEEKPKSKTVPEWEGCSEYILREWKECACQEKALCKSENTFKEEICAEKEGVKAGEEISKGQEVKQKVP